MAKKIPHKKSSYTLQFLLPGPEQKKGDTGLLSTFAEKLKSEQIIHADLSEEIQEGYVLIFESFNMESQVNPGEFMQLELPEANSQKRFWDFSFNGKKGSGPGGLILPLT